VLLSLLALALLLQASLLLLVMAVKASMTSAQAPLRVPRPA
jgi:hypothetical protein